ncbi:hypothetical protein ACQEVF_17735 [Nonomuraea polychroma]|uniref:hypothetical protein n=1 Tax=Nonomuraea polychroma TaxID=46176 RepID=UPI003D94867C
MIFVALSMPPTTITDPFVYRYDAASCGLPPYQARSPAVSDCLATCSQKVTKPVLPKLASVFLTIRPRIPGLSRAIA